MRSARHTEVQASALEPRRNDTAPAVAWLIAAVLVVLLGEVTK